MNHYLLVAFSITSLTLTILCHCYRPPLLPPQQSELIVFDNILALVDQTAYPLKDAVLVCRTWLTALKRLAETLRKRSTKKGTYMCGMYYSVADS